MALHPQHDCCLPSLPRLLVSKSSLHGPPPPPPGYKPVPARAPNRRGATKAFGFIIDDALRSQWCRCFRQVLQKGRASAEGKGMETEDPVERTTRLGYSDCLCGLIYYEIPELPRIHNRLMPVADGALVPRHHIFALKDDSSWQAMNVRLTPELIEAVRNRLGVEDQQPQWYGLDSS